jgi:DNA-binding beta-propeller fold protein YncE
MGISVSGTVLSSVMGLVACGTPSTTADCDDPGTACTWAGKPGVQGLNKVEADRRHSLLSWPTDIGFASDGRGYIVDWNNHEVRRIEPDDTLRTVMGNAVESEGAPDGADYLPPSAPLGALGTAISLNHPTNLDFLPDGRIVVASWHGLRFRVFDPATSLARVIAGDGEYGDIGDGGPAYRAQFNLPRSVAVGPSGRLYVLDQKNLRIRTFEASPTSIVTTFAGNGTKGYSGDGGPAIDAQISFANHTSLPSGGLAVDADHVYIADAGNHRIRRVAFATGMIDCIAGIGGAGYSGDGGAAMAASLNGPADLAIGPDGRLYFADSYNNVIRRIDLASGAIDTVAGTGVPCALGATCLESEEGLPARDVVLNGPLGLGFDAAGNLHITDTYNNRVVRIARDW